jgi:hypothetical protein
MKRPETLRQWVKFGYATADAGDGAWAWTKRGEEIIPAHVRTLLSDLLYGHEVPKYLREILERYFIDPDTGMFLEDE